MLGRELLNFIKFNLIQFTLIGTALFLYAVALSIKAGWLYILDAFLLSGIILNYVMPGLMLKQLKVKRILPQQMFEGDEAQITLRLSNHSRRSKHLISITDPLPGLWQNPDANFTLKHLAGYQSLDFTFNLLPSKRGAYPVPPLKLGCDIPFGFYRRQRQHFQNQEILVYPKIYDLKAYYRMGGDRLKLGEGVRNFAGESFDFLKLREHQSNEDIRLVHWPTSARLGQLMVKEFKHPAPGAFNLILDNKNFEGNAPEILEQGVSLWVNLAYHLNKSGAGLGLWAGKAEKIVSAIYPDSSHILEFYTRVQSDSAIPGIKLLHTARKTLPQSRHNLICLMSTSYREWEDAVNLSDCIFVILQSQNHPSDNACEQFEVILRSRGAMLVYCLPAGDIVVNLRQIIKTF